MKNFSLDVGAMMTNKMLMKRFFSHADVSEACLIVATSTPAAVDHDGMQDVSAPLRRAQLSPVGRVLGRRQFKLVAQRMEKGWVRGSIEREHANGWCQKKSGGCAHLNVLA